MVSEAQLNPSAAINHPPAKHKQRQCKRQVPPEWKKDAHHNAQHGEEEPEDFLFHLRKPYQIAVIADIAVIAGNRKTKILTTDQH